MPGAELGPRPGRCRAARHATACPPVLRRAPAARTWPHGCAGARPERYPRAREQLPEPDRACPGADDLHSTRPYGVVAMSPCAAPAPSRSAAAGATRTARHRLVPQRRHQGREHGPGHGQQADGDGHDHGAEVAAPVRARSEYRAAAAPRPWRGAWSCPLRSARPGPGTLPARRPGPRRGRSGPGRTTCAGRGWPARESR